LKHKYKTKVTRSKLDKSSVSRRQIKAKLGWEPISMIWGNPRKKALDNFVKDTLASEKHAYHKHQYSVRDGALSQNPTAVIEKLLKFYGYGISDGWLFNPFMERLPHLLIAHQLGWNVCGYDISQEAYEHDVKRLKELFQPRLSDFSHYSTIVDEGEDFMETIIDNRNFNIYRRDSRNTDFQDDYFDLIFGSPPYWDTEEYGSEPEQLGKGKGYEEFLQGLGEVAKEIWQVNDFRKDKVFYPYHKDVMDVLKNAGLKFHDIVVYNVSLHPIKAIFTTQLVRDKYVAKAHEYAIVMRK